MKRLVAFLLAGSLGVACLFAQEAVPVPVGTNAVPASATNSVGTNGVAATLEKIDAEARDLKPGDVLRFSIDQDPAAAKLIQLVDVTAAGEALFPVSKESDRYVKLNARGKKLAALRQEVKQLLDVEYYNDCTVKIDLDQIRNDPSVASAENSAKVTVFGVTSGSIFIREGETKTLTDLIIQLGQLGPRAKLDEVRIRRLDPSTRRELVTEHNVRKLLKEGDRSKDPVLKDGDRVEIPERVLNF
jgi:protein involved in polysaccharide export with SLBB domain